MAKLLADNKENNWTKFRHFQTVYDFGVLYVVDFVQLVEACDGFR